MIRSLPANISIPKPPTTSAKPALGYKQLVAELTEQGFVIQGVTIDGKRGVAKAFGDIPVQMCHFHQVAIIKRYLTSRPKLEASIKICRRIPTTTETRFAELLLRWHTKHKTFLEDIVPLEGKKRSIQPLADWFQLMLNSPQHIEA